MGALSFDALFRSLKKGALDPVYYLYGDEDVLKQEAIESLLEHGLDAATRDFNLDQRDAGSLDPEAFHALVQTPPMLAARRVVVLRGVEQLRKKSKIRDELTRYLGAPSPDTVLVLLQGSGEEAEADLMRRATAVDFKPLPPDRVRRWIDHRAGKLGITLEPGVADQLIEIVAGELGAVAQELDKLAALAHGGGGAVTVSHLEAVAGVQRGQTIPDLVAAILGGDTAKAAGLIGPVLDQSGVSGVKIVSALGTALIGTALARAELDRGTPAHRLAETVKNHIESVRPAGLGSWRDAAARWSGWAQEWKAAELRGALRLALAADVALKNSTVSDEGAIIMDLVVRLGVGVAV
jgi:DNA polymerase III subunit delta